MKRSGEEIYKALRALGVPASSIRIADEFYQTPTKKWLLGPFAEYYTGVVKTLLEGGFYSLEANDCDNFALGFTYWAKTLNAREKKRNKRCDIAVGTFWYQSPQGGHAINVAMVEKGKIIFLEPQGGVGELKLTKRECESCSECCF